MKERRLSALPYLDMAWLFHDVEVVMEDHLVALWDLRHEVWKEVMDYIPYEMSLEDKSH